MKYQIVTKFTSLKKKIIYGLRGKTSIIGFCSKEEAIKFLSKLGGKNDQKREETKEKNKKKKKSSKN